MPVPELDEVPWVQTKFRPATFLQLVQVMNLAIRKGWPVWIQATDEPSFVVTAVEPYDKEIKKLLDIARESAA